jgi:heavy metal sensor kinase
MFLKKKIRFQHTLAFRLTLWYAGFFSLSACVAFLFFYLLITSVFEDQTDRDLYKQMGVFSTIMAADGIEAVERFAELESQAAGEKKVFYRLLYPTGISFSSSNMSYWRDIGVTRSSIEQVMAGQGPVYETLSLSKKGQKVRILYNRIGSGIILQQGQSMENVARFIEAFRKIFITTMLLLIILSAAVGWFMARRAVSGVEAVTRTAANIAAGSLEERVPLKAKGDEINQLATTFNHMLDRIQKLVSGMKEISDNIAHDLKSPITRIRGAAEVVLTTGNTLSEFKQMAASNIEECDRLLDMINTMLMISKTEAGVGEFDRQKIDLSGIIQDACELFQPMAADKGVSLECDSTEDITVMGDMAMLQRMSANLLDNAIKYTPAGGRVHVSIQSEGDGQTAITIKDTGIGIAQHNLPYIFDRFYRCDPSRSTAGAGLGLSLAKAIAETHQGRIEVTSKEGQGSTFKIFLPQSLPG